MPGSDYEPAPARLWTAAEAAASDRYTMATLGMPSPVLMERAALCVSAEVERLATARGVEAVLVLVGPGNNGGDGLAVARQLHGRGRLEVQVVLVSPTRNAAATQQLALALAHGVCVSDSLPDREALALGDRVIVDALLGTGSRGAPRGPIEAAMVWLGGGSGCGVVAIDIPSGIDVDTGAVPGVAIAATVTVSFARSKIGLHLTPARAYAGRVVVADIGLVEPGPGEGAGRDPDSGHLDLVDLIGPQQIAAALELLPTAAHKGVRGHVGVVGGTGGTPGAAVLAGEAALRAGAGLATLATGDEQLRRALIELRPELMLADADDPHVAGADVLVVGPGLTGGLTGAPTGLTELDSTDPRPMVWDASALSEFRVGPSAGPRIATPHPGEAARMLARLEQDPSWTSARVQADRRAAASRLVTLTGGVVVLKGEASVVARRHGRGVQLAIATTGGPALATAGSGDVLAGAIAALLARGLDPWMAALVGVHVHGLAGERCPADGTLASDVAAELPEALALARSGVMRPDRWPALVRG